MAASTAPLGLMAPTHNDTVQQTGTLCILRIHRGYQEVTGTDGVSPSKHALRSASTESDVLISAVSSSARLLVREGAVRAEALMREIAGQGPEKTLSRGFAMVRGHGGKTVTGATEVIDGDEIQIQFHDGKIEAIAEKHL